MMDDDIRSTGATPTTPQVPGAAIAVMLARHEIRRAERIAAQEAPRNRKGSCEAGTQAEKPGLQATELSKRTRALKSFPLTHVHRAQHPNTQKVQQNGFLQIIPVSIIKPIWSIS